MHEFETEEQQIEALKKWWKENATSLILGVSVGAFALGGWSLYTQSQHSHRLEASDLFMELLRQAEKGGIDTTANENANRLVADYADTPYAALSSLTLAALDHDQGKLESALSHLNWVNAHAIDEETRHLARLRIARILLGQNKLDEAEGWLSDPYPASFAARYEELKGDLFVARGQIEQARIAYDKAISQSTSANRWLKLKRQDLGPSALESQAVNEPPA